MGGIQNDCFSFCRQKNRRFLWRVLELSFALSQEKTGIPALRALANPATVRAGLRLISFIIISSARWRRAELTRRSALRTALRTPCSARRSALRTALRAPHGAPRSARRSALRTALRAPHGAPRSALSARLAPIAVVLPRAPSFPPAQPPLREPRQKPAARREPAEQNRSATTAARATRRRPIIVSRRHRRRRRRLDRAPGGRATRRRPQARWRA